MNNPSQAKFDKSFIQYLRKAAKHYPKVARQAKKLEEKIKSE